MSFHNTLPRKIKYLFHNFPLVIHLLFKTQSLGVNNKWFDGSIKHSIFGLNLIRQIFNVLLIYPIVVNYRQLKWRMSTTVGFVPKSEYELMFKDQSFYERRNAQNGNS